VDDGLPTEITKCVVTDKLGYVWIATDEGLVKYDGHEFEVFYNELPSNFVKDILITSDYRMLVASDFGISEVVSRPDTVYFKTLLRGYREPYDTAVWYPKNLFEDSKGNIWISEPGSIVKFRDGILRRYSFGEEDHSYSFSRSFIQLEDENQQVWAISYTGGLYRFQPETDQFEMVFRNNTLSEANTFNLINGQKYIGCSTGLFRILTDSLGRISVEPVLDVKNVSSMAQLDGEQVILGSYVNPVVQLNINEPGSSKEIGEFFVVYDVYVSDFQDIWLSTHQGVILLQKNIFNKLDLDQPFYFIESVEKSEKENAYYFCDRSNLFRYSLEDRQWQKIFNDPKGYLLSISSHENDVYVSSKSSILQFRNGNLVRTYDRRGFGFYIFNIETDHLGNVWFSQDNTKGVFKINGESVVQYAEHDGLLSRIIVSKHHDDKMYFGGASDSGYLYSFDFETEEFHNLSRRLPYQSEQEFEVRDMAFINDDIWLATTLGLLRFDGDSIYSGSSHPFLSSPLRALSSSKDQNLWISSSLGVGMFDTETEEVFIFNESSGLPSITGSMRGIHSDQNGTSWIATSKGLARTKFNADEVRTTPKPIVEGISVGNKSFTYNLHEVKHIPYQGFFQTSVFTPAFPGNSITYQFKIQKGRMDGEWKKFNSTNSLELIPEFSGPAEIRIRGRKEGGYLWSHPVILKIKVAQPWYFQPFTIFSFFILAVCMFWIGYLLNRLRSRKQREKLNREVEQRTMELKLANDKLKNTNKELDMFVYSASHDLRAPLTSILGLVNVYFLESEEKQKSQIVRLISTSVKKLDQFIQDVISFSRNSRLGVERSKIDFHGLIRETVAQHMYMDGSEEVNIYVDVRDEVEFFSDKRRIQIILNNLISNAIRYRNPLSSDQYIRINVIQQEKEAHITIRDNGVGIGREHIGKVFDMFYRASENTSGSGLGLYITREIITVLGGSITLRSKIGKGSCFEITIPNLRGSILHTHQKERKHITVD
jgi:signal transduction histidine kinase